MQPISLLKLFLPYQEVCYKVINRRYIFIDGPGFCNCSRGVGIGKPKKLIGLTKIHCFTSMYIVHSKDLGLLL